MATRQVTLDDPREVALTRKVAKVNLIETPAVPFIEDTLLQEFTQRMIDVWIFEDNVETKRVIVDGMSKATPEQIDAIKEILTPKVEEPIEEPVVTP